MLYAKILHFSPEIQSRDLGESQGRVNRSASGSPDRILSAVVAGYRRRPLSKRLPRARPVDRDNVRALLPPLLSVVLLRGFGPLRSAESFFLRGLARLTATH